MAKNSVNGTVTNNWILRLLQNMNKFSNIWFAFLTIANLHALLCQVIFFKYEYILRKFSQSR